MELYIAGGVGEHGRNCFYLQNGEDAILVDCGLMADSDDPQPRLTENQIRKLKAVFLTHSHADHTGALPWLLRQGYTGPIISTTPTLQQLPFIVQNAVALEQVAPRNEKCNGITWGLSGHCEGSVWLKLDWDDKAILFSGDYTEQSAVYPCDVLRHQVADLAVLDCAYGHDSTPWNDSVTAAAAAVENLLEKNPIVFLPVPKYGRGLDLLLQIRHRLPYVPMYGDAHFCKQTEIALVDGKWYKPLPQRILRSVRPDAAENEGVVFLSDPQLRGAVGERAKELLEQGAMGIMTGTPDAGSFSSALLAEKKMEFWRYPVHLNETQCRVLAEKNNFSQVLRYHSPNFASPHRITMK